MRNLDFGTITATIATLFIVGLPPRANAEPSSLQTLSTSTQLTRYQCVRAEDLSNIDCSTDMDVIDTGIIKARCSLKGAVLDAQTGSQTPVSVESWTRYYMQLGALGFLEGGAATSTSRQSIKNFLKRYGCDESGKQRHGTMPVFFHNKGDKVVWQGKYDARVDGEVLEVKPNGTLVLLREDGLIIPGALAEQIPIARAGLCSPINSLACVGKEIVNPNYYNNKGQIIAMFDSGKWVMVGYPKLPAVHVLPVETLNIISK